MNSPESYIPILIQIGVAVGFVVLTLSLSHLLGPNRKTKQREENFECGIESQGNARFPVSGSKPPILRTPLLDFS